MNSTRATSSSNPEQDNATLPVRTPEVGVARLVNLVPYNFLPIRTSRRRTQLLTDGTSSGDAPPPASAKGLLFRPHAVAQNRMVQSSKDVHIAAATAATIPKFKNLLWRMCNHALSVPQKIISPSLARFFASFLTCFLVFFLQRTPHGLQHSNQVCVQEIQQFAGCGCYFFFPLL